MCTHCVPSWFTFYFVARWFFFFLSLLSFFSLVVAVAFISFAMTKSHSPHLHRCYRPQAKNTENMDFVIFFLSSCIGYRTVCRCWCAWNMNQHEAFAFNVLCFMLPLDGFPSHHTVYSRSMEPTQSTQSFYYTVKYHVCGEFPKCWQTHFDIYLAPFLAMLMVRRLLLLLIHNKWTSVITKLIIYKTILSS